jgi:hypothetical protein
LSLVDADEAGIAARWLTVPDDPTVVAGRRREQPPTASSLGACFLPHQFDVALERQSLTAQPP